MCARRISSGPGGLRQASFDRELNQQRTAPTESTGCLRFEGMPEGGLEPPRDKVPADFESAAYANFATPAAFRISRLQALPISRLWKCATNCVTRHTIAIDRSGRRNHTSAGFLPRWVFCSFAISRNSAPSARCDRASITRMGYPASCARRHPDFGSVRQGDQAAAQGWSIV